MRDSRRQHTGDSAVANARGTLTVRQTTAATVKATLATIADRASEQIARGGAHSGGPNETPLNVLTGGSVAGRLSASSAGSADTAVPSRQADDSEDAETHTTTSGTDGERRTSTPLSQPALSRVGSQ